MPNYVKASYLSQGTPDPTDLTHTGLDRTSPVKVVNGNVILKSRRYFVTNIPFSTEI